VRQPFSECPQNPEVSIAFTLLKPDRFLLPLENTIPQNAQQQTLDLHVTSVGLGSLPPLDRLQHSWI
jgi:hypothetical protein